MKTCLLFALLFAANVLHAQRTFDVTIGDSTYHMKKYWFVLYTKGDGPALDSLTAAKLQEEHLAHQDAQAARGLIVMAGPFDTNEAGWRGLLLYDCETQEEVEGYLRQDPFVKVSRLKYEVRPWLGGGGDAAALTAQLIAVIVMRFPLKVITSSTPRFISACPIGEATETA